MDDHGRMILLLLAIAACGEFSAVALEPEKRPCSVVTVCNPACHELCIPKYTPEELVACDDACGNPVPVTDCVWDCVADLEVD